MHIFLKFVQLRQLKRLSQKAGEPKNAAQTGVTVYSINIVRFGVML
jgi:hypothetical protein